MEGSLDAIERIADNSNGLSDGRPRRIGDRSECCRTAVRGGYLYDTPSGDLEVGDYAVQPNGSYIENAPPFVSSTSTVPTLRTSTTSSVASSSPGGPVVHVTSTSTVPGSPDTSSTSTDTSTPSSTTTLAILLGADSTGAGKDVSPTPIVDTGTTADTTPAVPVPERSPLHGQRNEDHRDHNSPMTTRLLRGRANHVPSR